jgi:phosphoribosylglycinamide formyltransferase-1
MAQKEAWPAHFAGVIANHPQAKGLDFAREVGIPTFIIDHRDFVSREAFDAALIATIDELKPNLVVLAGFMRILTAGFIDQYQGRLMNIHPSLLPSFAGLHTHQRALDAGVSKHGATVHFVTTGVDEGPIISQAELTVVDGENEAQLAARVLRLEHQIYPRAVKWFIDDRLRVEGNKVKLTPPETQFFASGTL